jgi:ferredoxin
MPKIAFINEKKDVEVPEGTNLREAAIKAGVPVYRKMHELLNCRGKGFCATCRMLVVGNTIQNCSPMTPLEKMRLKLSYVYIGFENEMRLSCQTRIKGDIQVITVPALNLYGIK